ncbi:four helix bundle protein [Candidatus Nitrospira bockiana]
MKVERFEDLDCWKQARILTRLTYELCRSGGLKADGRFRDQLTGASLSVMNNIAEGFGSQSNAEFRRFLTYARRSVSEVQSCLFVALDCHSVHEERVEAVYRQAEITRKVIDGLLRYLRASRTRPSADERRPIERTKLTQRT